MGTVIAHKKTVQCNDKISPVAMLIPWRLLSSTSPRRTESTMMFEFIRETATDTGWCLDLQTNIRIYPP